MLTTNAKKCVAWRQASASREEREKIENNKTTTRKLREDKQSSR